MLRLLAITLLFIAIQSGAQDQSTIHPGAAKLYQKAERLRMVAPDKAIARAIDGIRLAEDYEDQTLLQKLLLSVGKCYNALGNSDSARYFFDRIVEISAKQGERDMVLAETYMGIGTD